MSGRRSVLRACAVVVTGGTLAGCTGGGETARDGTDAGATTVSPTAAFDVRSPAFDDGGTIPPTYTADGDDVSPPLEIEGVPDDAGSLALVVDDPAVQDGSFSHWLLWNVPPGTATIPEAITQSQRVPELGDARQGTNGFGELGYRGPRPPPDDDAHTYRFTLYAVAEPLNLQAGVRYPRLDEALDGAVVSTARLTGEYGR